MISKHEEGNKASAAVSILQKVDWKQGQSPEMNYWVVMPAVVCHVLYVFSAKSGTTMLFECQLVPTLNFVWADL